MKHTSINSPNQGLELRAGECDIPALRDRVEARYRGGRRNRGRQRQRQRRQRYRAEAEASGIRG